MQPTNKKLSVVFAGTPDISHTVLSGLIDSKRVEIIGALTQPDRPSGRGRQNKESPVKQLANLHNIPVYQPISFKKNSEVIDKLKVLKPDLMVVIAYGLILPQSVLDIPNYGCINIHVSLLPKYRGAAPIQRAIENGDTKTGVTIMQMDCGLDTGDILYVSETTIDKDDTAKTLENKLSSLSITALLETIHLIQTDSLNPIKQTNENATYAEKINKREGQVNWGLNAVEIERKMRAFDPWPGTFIVIDGQIVKLYDAKVIDKAHHEKPGTILSVSKNDIQIATGNGILSVGKLQFPGKKVLAIQDILNGRNLNNLIGSIIGE